MHNQYLYQRRCFCPWHETANKSTDAFSCILHFKIFICCLLRHITYCIIGHLFCRVFHCENCLTVPCNHWEQTHETPTKRICHHF